MVQSRVQAGRPYENPKGRGERRAQPDSRRGLLKWSGRPLKNKASKNTAPPAIKTGRLIGAKADAPVGHIAVTELAFLSIRNFFVLAALATIAVLLVYGLVRSNHQSVELSYEISALAQARLSAIEDNRRLKMDIARLTSLDQLEIAARETLGMVAPKKEQIVVIE